MNEKTLTFKLSGRVDSSNATEVGEELEEFRKTPHDALIIDADDLEYIASAGLRILLRARKSEQELTVINASSEVYDILEMTGFTEMINVQKAFRRMSVDGCPVIGKGAKGTVYRYDPETVIKVYNSADCLPSIKKERELARRAFVLGIPTAISYDVVRVGDSYGSVFELLDADSYSRLIADHPENFDKYVGDFAELLRTIHSTEANPGDMPDIRTSIKGWVDIVAPYLSTERANKLDSLVKNTPECMNVLHCDYHTNNVMLQNGETLLIDMDTLSHGNPVFDLANIHIAYVGFGVTDPSYVENFIGLPYETCVKFWNKFIVAYLGTDDPAVVAEAEDKIKLVSYTRLVRHYVRRRAGETEEGRAHINAALDKLIPLLDSVNSIAL